MLPFFAGLLPGVLSAGKKIISGVASDVMSGKGLGSSLKRNLSSAINDVIPGGTAMISKLVGSKGRRLLNKGARTLDAGTSAANPFMRMLPGTLSKALPMPMAPSIMADR